MDWRKFIFSFRYAIEGVLTAFSEQNMRVHLFSAIVVIVAGFLTGLSVLEWCVIVVVIGLVIAVEMLNTALERVVDLASPDIHPFAKQAKDLAAGAVLVIAIVSVIIGLLIFLPKWL